PPTPTLFPYTTLFRSPPLPSLPPVALQEVGGGSQHVGDAVLEVAAPVAVEIDGILVVARGQELGVADLAGPAAAHLRRRQVAARSEEHTSELQSRGHL